MRLPWPLPALVAWLAAWLLYLWLAPRLGALAALAAGCALGTAASLWGGPWWRRWAIALGFPLSLAASGVGALPAWAWLVALALLLAVYPLNAWRDAPLFPTPEGALDALATHARLPEGARVLDAGCGLGAGLRALRRAYPRAQLHGLERSPVLRWLCALRCPWARVRGGDIWAADWSGYQLVYLFQRPESMGRALVKTLEMAPGSWLVSLEFALPDTRAHASLALTPGRRLWLYRLPALPEEGAEGSQGRCTGNESRVMALSFPACRSR